MTTPTPLADVMALLEKATPGEWRWSENGNIVPEIYTQDCEIAAVYSEHDNDDAPANAAAIIAAVNYLRQHAPHIAELEADARRLEWVIAHRDYRVQGSNENGWFVLDCSNGLTFLTKDKYRTFRYAIDAAMQATPNGSHAGKGECE